MDISLAKSDKNIHQIQVQYKDTVIFSETKQYLPPANFFW